MENGNSATEAIDQISIKFQFKTISQSWGLNMIYKHFLNFDKRYVFIHQIYFRNKSKFSEDFYYVFLKHSRNELFTEF